MGAVEQLERLKGLADKAISVRGDTSKLSETFKTAFATDGSGNVNLVINHAAVIASCMMDLHFMEDSQWKKLVAIHFKSYFDDDSEELCNCTFTLAYGTKILLHNTKMRLKRGKNYGLLGGNDSGKSTLVRAIANNQVEGFPDTNEVRTVFVEADIQGEQSQLSCIDYIHVTEEIQALNITREEITSFLSIVGFTDDGKAKPNHAVFTLSGGWRMKLALARVMLQKTDILLLDEPRSHLDVINVAWVKSYLNSLTEVTAIIVSHGSGLINGYCTHMLQIENLKLHTFKGRLDEFVKINPSARAYFSISTPRKFGHKNI